ncbi:MAG: signal transduction histidine kinase [Desulforhopalus sp.]|jgi:signal transduction histidine kinase
MRLVGYKRIWEVVITICICLVVSKTSFFPWLSEIGLDLLFKTRGIKQTSQSIVIVGIDEASLAKYGPWPFARSSHGLLLEQLKEAKAIGFDLIFSHPDNDDKIFLESIDSAPPVVMAVASNYQGNVLRPGNLFTGKVKLGHIETELGTDGIVRRIQLHKLDVPVLAAAMVEVSSLRNQVTTDVASSRLINFYGPEFTFFYIPYIDVLEGNYNNNFFKDRYVLVGSQALALGDVHITPFSKKHPIPGVEVQATILNNIIENSFLKELNWLVWSLGLVCLWMLVWLWPHKTETQNALICLVFGLFITLLSGILFYFNYFLSLGVPIFVLLVSYISHSIFWWIKITAGMVKEIKVLDRQLVDGVETVFTTLPSSLTYIPKAGTQLSLTSGFQKHIIHMHRGIQALALQNGFINHLLSEETPPLILWQKENGLIVLANNRFSSLWKTTINPGESLPTLDEFQSFISRTMVINKKNTDNVDYQQLEFGIVDSIVDISTICAGKKAHHRVVIHNVTDSELGFTGILASFTDVTEIRELERLKGEVMNIVSHELKLPLTTIMGFAEMLSESLEGPEKDYAIQIHNQSNRLAKMIGDFLDIARIESGKYLIHKYPFDLLTVVLDAASGVTYSATAKNIEMAYHLPQKVSPLLGDESLITQVILNLLDNAVKFSPVSAKVMLSVVEREETIELIVEDSGEGIDDVEKTMVFEKFNRGANQLKDSGFGLGLSFVKEVIEGHSGLIRVNDSALGGAKFTITLPKT